MTHTKKRLQPLQHTSVGNPWLLHSSHPQEKEGGPKKNEKKKKNISLHSPARAGPPSDLFRSRNKTVGQETKPLFVSIKKQNRSRNKTVPCPATNFFGIFFPGTAHPVLP